MLGTTNKNQAELLLLLLGFLPLRLEVIQYSYLEFYSGMYKTASHALCQAAWVHFALLSATHTEVAAVTAIRISMTLMQQRTDCV